MKILHITETYTPLGGIEQYLLALIELLRCNGHANQVVYLRPHPQTIAGGSCPARLISIEAPEQQARPELTRFIQQQAPDVVLLHAVYDAWVVEAAHQASPTAAYLHGFAPTCPALSKFFRRGDQVCERSFGLGCIQGILYHRCSEARSPLTIYRRMRDTQRLQRAYQSLDKVIVAGAYMQELLTQNGFDRSRIKILPPHFQEVHPYYEPQGRPPVVLFSGRLEAEKGLAYLLQACLHTRSSFQLLIAGDGSRRAEYEQLAQQLDVQERVTFLGWLDRDAMSAAFRRASVVVMPSVFPEPFGKVGIEALAHGRPVIAFRVGGIPDWLEEERSGRLVPTGDVTGLAQAIDAFIENGQMASNLGQQGRAYVQDHYAPEQYLQKFAALVGQTG